MPIPHADRAVASCEKVRDYLLNREHPDGGPKAAWFENLGYDRSEWQALAVDLLAIAMTCYEYSTERSVHGVKYKASGSIGRPENRPGRVLTVWIVEEESPPRLVTAYPDVNS